MQKSFEITDLSVPEMDIYLRYSESRLLHYFEPDCGIFIAESPKVISRALDAGYQPISFLCAEDVHHPDRSAVLGRCTGTTIYTAKSELLSRITGFQFSSGLLSAMRRNPCPDITELCRNASRIAVLEDVVNPRNIGAIFRNAAALGMDAVLLTGGCTDPLYRRAARVSMGTVFQVSWTYFPKHASYIEILKNLGFLTVAMALRNDTRNITDPFLKSAPKLAVILGTEGEGLTDESISACDATVKIPMTHGVDSLNVAAASAVAFWELGTRNL
ncbi:MAG: RNA methyltransferase [Oscillospiraceae bacterium]|nr:RNA methyltransferase [Oscillospiraceae bacterium]